MAKLNKFVFMLLLLTAQPLNAYGELLQIAGVEIAPGELLQIAGTATLGIAMAPLALGALGFWAGGVVAYTVGATVTTVVASGIAGAVAGHVAGSNVGKNEDKRN